MRVIHALDPLDKSIFLAGPTPRADSVPSWRPEALSKLETMGFDGTVFVPEPSGKGWAENYDSQIFWEWEAIHQATVTVFWVPRDLADMPAFTTNVEFGLTAASSRILLAWPEGQVPKMGYLNALAKRYHIPTYRSLDALLEAAVERCRSPYGA